MAFLFDFYGEDPGKESISRYFTGRGRSAPPAGSPASMYFSNAGAEHEMQGQQNMGALIGALVQLMVMRNQNKVKERQGLPQGYGEGAGRQFNRDLGASREQAGLVPDQSRQELMRLLMQLQRPPAGGYSGY